MRILHTADWHVGRTLRGRSRIEEHESVLAEIATIVRDEDIELVLVVGDIFDSSAPTPEAERVAYRALLDIASSGAEVLMLSGNHDSERRLQAVAPVLDLGGITVRASFLSPAEGGVIEGVSRQGEPWRVATIPFLSQRWVMRGEDLLERDADQHAGKYAARVARLIMALTRDFTPEAINVVAAHLHVTGGVLGGGERLAHTIFDYAVSGHAFPAAAHYVALGHLHRAQRIAGPCPIRYSGSPLQLDFGEVSDTKSVTIINAKPGVPAEIIEVPLASGRRLRTLCGSFADLSAAVGTTGDDWLKLVVREEPRIGLADDLREQFPDAIDVIVEPSGRGSPGRPDDGLQPDPAGRADKTPHDLFVDYLRESGGPADPRMVALFDRLLDEVSST